MQTSLSLALPFSISLSQYLSLSVSPCLSLPLTSLSCGLNSVSLDFLDSLVFLCRGIEKTTILEVVHDDVPVVPGDEQPARGGRHAPHRGLIRAHAVVAQVAFERHF
jgi:hypothetical protein